MFTEKEIAYLDEIKKVANAGPFTADWASLSAMPQPAWFSQARFGIFIHWGLYYIAAHANEWYSRNMYIKDKEEWQYHRDTFGDHQDFGYKDFIPLFTAEAFDPAEWAALFKEAGAKYVFPVAEHHEGFQMYKSDISHFNAYEMGPHRDILGELKETIEAQGMTFCTSSHRAEHWWFMSHGREFDSDIHEPMERGDFYWPAMPEPHEADLTSQPYPSQEFLDDWLLRTCEIIDKYQPSLLYFDWWIQHDAFKEHLKTLAAYYYNRGKEWGKEVAICYKHDAMMWGSGILEVERGALNECKPYVWQTDTAIAKNSWCYTDTLDYKSSRQIIQTFVECISKNGNMLLNVGPKGDGSIPDKDRDILLEIGAWMKRNEEAIYGSRPWKIDSEGPTQIAQGQFTDNEELAYTSEDIRFVAKGDSIYAFVMKPSSDITIKSLAYSLNQNTFGFHGLIENVSILGYESTLTSWSVDQAGLHLHTAELATDLPLVVKITPR